MIQSGIPRSPREELRNTLIYRPRGFGDWPSRLIHPTRPFQQNWPAELASMLWVVAQEIFRQFLRSREQMKVDGSTQLAELRAVHANGIEHSFNCGKNLC